MERLVTQEDLNKYPQLKSMGVSVNQHYNFDYLEANETPPVAQKKSKEPEKEEPKKTTNGRKK